MAEKVKKTALELKTEIRKALTPEGFLVEKTYIRRRFHKSKNHSD